MGVSTLINIHTLGQVGELLVLPAGDDVGADQPEPLVAPDSGPVLVVVWPVLVLDDSIFDLRKIVTPFSCAGGHT